MEKNQNNSNLKLDEDNLTYFKNYFCDEFYILFKLLDAISLPQKYTEIAEETIQPLS